ncbi:MAG: hypothetical protein OTI36_16495, partial [Beijerinckiaceae bacterium]|nr:hypothetical protein [Beijerinckiaceae bacterium]
MSDIAFQPYREPPRRDIPLWIVAGLVVLAVHLAGIYFLMNRRAGEPNVDTQNAVEIDLAPPELAPAPREEQAPATSAPPPAPA